MPAESSQRSASALRSNAAFLKKTVASSRANLALYSGDRTIAARVVPGHSQSDQSHCQAGFVERNLRKLECARTWPIGVKVLLEQAGRPARVVITAGRARMRAQCALAL